MTTAFTQGFAGDGLEDCVEINDSSSVVISSAIKIHTKLGSGVFESAYRRLLRHELMLRGCTVESQKVLDLEYEGVVFDPAYRVDKVVNDHLLVNF
jgi:GxxExxY protein